MVIAILVLVYKLGWGTQIGWCIYSGLFHGKSQIWMMDDDGTRGTLW